MKRHISFYHPQATMLSPCVALMVFAAAVSGQWSIPLRQNLLPVMSPAHLKVRYVVQQMSRYMYVQ